MFSQPKASLREPLRAEEKHRTRRLEFCRSRSSHFNVTAFNNQIKLDRSQIQEVDLYRRYQAIFQGQHQSKSNLLGKQLYLTLPVHLQAPQARRPKELLSCQKRELWSFRMNGKCWRVSMLERNSKVSNRFCSNSLLLVQDLAKAEGWACLAANSFRLWFCR